MSWSVYGTAQLSQGSSPLLLQVVLQPVQVLFLRPRHRLSRLARRCLWALLRAAGRLALDGLGGSWLCRGQRSCTFQAADDQEGLPGDGEHRALCAAHQGPKPSHCCTWPSCMKPRKREPASASCSPGRRDAKLGSCWPLSPTSGCKDCRCETQHSSCRPRHLHGLTRNQESRPRAPLGPHQTRSGHDTLCPKDCWMSELD
mmetsp:Transcript_67616/g.135792  ORF Transcript_67616/g.135792 Transcript_67616/m.135792 type:complete len:201 (+) Transcript_67616:271-873(+)